MTCILSEHTGASCKTCNKFLLPPQVVHQVRGEPQLDTHNTLTSTVDSYCDACCPVHQGKRPMTDRELVAWLKAPFPTELLGSTVLLRWKTLSGLEGCIGVMELGAGFDTLTKSVARSYKEKGGKKLSFELILLLRETE